MPSITTWTRLEPSSRADDLAAALSAPIADPAWLLARQWQVGEFAGTDGGSAATTRVRAQAAHVTALATPGGVTMAVNGTITPIEPLVEAEQTATADIWLAVEAGQHFVRLLGQHGNAASYAAAYISAYPLQLPAPGDPTMNLAAAGRLSLLAGRIADGIALAGALRSAVTPATGSPALPAHPPVSAGDIPAVLSAAQVFLTWYDGFLVRPLGTGCWVPERMEYQFRMSAPGSSGGLALAAPEYDGGLIDWDDFVVQEGAEITGATTSDSIVAASVPTPVSYPGMPSPRWWQFDDAGVSLGETAAAPQDLGRMLLIEFASTYANNWHLMPLQVAPGTVCGISSLVLTDTFGVSLLISPASAYDGAANWGMFRLSTLSAAGSPSAPVSMLLVPPMIGLSLDRGPIEEVLLLRDELAEMAWAIEKVVASPLGSALDRSEQLRALEQPPPVHQPLAELVYRLRSPVPENWIPFVPAGAMTGHLRRSALEGGAFGGPITPVPPAGRILQPGSPLEVFSEEIPRAGARVTRNWRYGRDSAGDCYLWAARQRSVGNGEGSSGLRYDALEQGLPPGQQSA